MTTQSSLVLDGVKLNYVHTIINPNFPTLIFLHDSLGCIELWRSFPKDLTEKRDVNLLIYDRQGYGQSESFDQQPRDRWYMHKEADTLQKLITQLNLKEVMLFGHSDGGTIALLYASKYPKLLKGIIVEGSHVLVEDITIEGIQKFEKLYATTNLKDKLSKYHGEKTQDIFDRWTKTWQEPFFDQWHILEEISRVQCPTLIIQGEHDEFGSIKQVESIVNHLGTRAYFHIVENAEHTPHKEQKEVTLQITSLFIEGII